MAYSWVTRRLLGKGRCDSLAVFTRLTFFIGVSLLVRISLLVALSLLDELSPLISLSLSTVFLVSKL